MYAREATDLESIGLGGSDIKTEILQVEFDNSFLLDTKIRCPCDSPLLAGSMIQCRDCHVLQHSGCVLILEEPMEGFPPVPPHFLCETCRINRADPFLVTVAYSVHPMKLITSNIRVNGANPVQTMEKLFHLTRADMYMLQKPEYDVQVWCILLNDSVPFRMHWPLYADLKVNGISVRVIDRPGLQLLGVNGRDDGPIITACVSDGVNRISLTGCDARIFCLGVRIVKQLTIQQVLNLIPKEPDGEQFEVALARVCRCIGGGAVVENADSDSDLEVVADSVIVNLRCPMSGSRIKTAGRFRPCSHMGCFDLETFVELNQRSRKWQCPICLKNYSLENIIIDRYFNCITTMMRNCEEDVTEIEVKPDGFWRVKNENEHIDLAQWHFPDGTLSVALDEVNLNIGTLNQFKQESISERHTGSKLGTNKSFNVFCNSTTPEDTFTLTSANILQEKYGEDSSVNQESGGLFDLSLNTGIELDSASMNFDPTFGAVRKDPSALLGEANIIVLSDSEEENETLISPRTVCETGQADASWINFYVPHLGVSDSFLEDPGLTMDGSSCLSLLNRNDNGSDPVKPFWKLPAGPLAGSGLQLFGSEVNVSDTYVQHSSVTCPSPFDGFAPVMQMGYPTRVPDSSHCSSTDINNSLVDASLPFRGDAPSLQIFLPSRPDSTAEQSDLRGQPGISNGLHSEEWISLCLGSGSCNGGLGNSAAENGLNLGSKPAKIEGAMHMD